MPADYLALYDFSTVLKWHNQWLQILRLKDLGGAIATAAEKELPKPPFSIDEIEREIVRRNQLDIID